jgi:anion-transporting  ArsA/GET3 family ATPase
MADGHGPEHTDAATMLDRLRTRRLVIVSGKGGVGRTTLAALLGVALAERGRRVLVATTGHDDRLAWMLGLPKLEATPVAVDARLSVQRLVPNVALREYGAMIVKSERISAAVFDNRIVRRLLRAIPGLDDFTVLGKAWHEAVRGGTYDTVVLDGPATGHLVYTLGVPRAILGAVPPGPLTREAAGIDASLTDPEVTEAVLVGLPEAWPLTELGELGRTITGELGISIRSVVVNGVWPRASDTARTLVAAPTSDPQVGAWLEWVRTLTSGAERHAAAIETFRRGPAVPAGVRELVTVPWRFEGIGGAGDLQALRRELDTAEVVPVAGRALGA